MPTEKSTGHRTRRCSRLRNAYAAFRKFYNPLTRVTGDVYAVGRTVLQVSRPGSTPGQERRTQRWVPPDDKEMDRLQLCLRTTWCHSHLWVLLAGFRDQRTEQRGSFRCFTMCCRLQGTTPFATRVHFGSGFDSPSLISRGRGSPSTTLGRIR